MNSAGCDPTMDAAMTDSTSSQSEGELLEMATKAVRSKRLFFHPGNTSSILETTEVQFKNYVALAIDSEDPYSDFRRSMKEMVDAYGFKYWEHLEELLALYLRLNRKKNHGLIIDAFNDSFRTDISFSSLLHCDAAPSSKNYNWWEVKNESISACFEEGKYPKH